MGKRLDSKPDKLSQLAGELDAKKGQEDMLAALVALAADLLSVGQCSIMLYVPGDDDNQQLRVCACHGGLPDAAYTQRVAHGEGIAGMVAESGEAVLVEDIAHSSYAALARRQGSNDRSLMAAPISIEGKIVGVLNVTRPLHAEAFGALDLATLKIVSLFAGKAIQVVQLQNLLNSRFAQMALAQEAKKTIGGVMSANAYDPNKMAKIVAKSFFREMTQVGFDSNQIIQAASEIISQLSSSLNKHSKRMEK